MRRHLLVLSMIVTGAILGAKADAQELLVGMSDYASSVLLAVDSAGNWVSQHLHETGWDQRGNVFDSAGFQRTSNVAAFANYDWNGNRPLIVDQDGNCFWMNITNSTWSYEGRIPTIAGRAGTGQFVALAVYDAKLAAITDTGDWYERDITTPWHFRANILGEAGVVRRDVQSMGGIKALYR